MVTKNEKKTSSTRNATRRKPLRDRAAEPGPDGSGDRSDSPGGRGDDEALSESSGGTAIATATGEEADAEVVSHFQVGDKVEIIALSKWQASIYLGKVGWVRRIFTDDGSCVVGFDDGVADTLPMPTDHLRRYLPPPPPPPDIPEGSIVRGKLAKSPKKWLKGRVEYSNDAGLYLTGDRDSGFVIYDGLEVIELAEPKAGDAFTELMQALGEGLEDKPEPTIASDNDSPAIIEPQQNPITTAIAPSTFAETYEAEAQEIVALPNLVQLATQIQQAHQECEQASAVARSAENSALEHAKRAGRLLLEAKKEVKHGGWEAWRQEQVGIPSSTASLYQRVAEKWDELQEAKIDSLKAADRHFRAAKKLKSAAGGQTETKSPTSGDSQSAEKVDDRQVVPAANIQSIAPSGWIQTKDGFNLNPQHYRPEVPAANLPELDDEAEVVWMELPELDDALIAAHLVPGDDRATIEALLWECGFAVEEEGAIPTDPPNPYKGWQIATDSPNEGMLAICLYAPWGAWWGLATEEFFDYQDHDRAIEWAQGIVDRLDVAGERALGQLKPVEDSKPEKISAMRLRTIAQDQSAAVFKLLSHMKECLPEVDLLEVAEALEEAVMKVLEEWLLEEGK